MTASKQPPTSDHRPAGGPAGPHLDALARRELLYQFCSDCGRVQALARLACPGCGSWSLDWRRAGGEGQVHAVTVINRAPSESYLSLVPYTLVLVTLDERARFMAHATRGVKIGDRVRVDFFEHEGRPLLRFVPVTEASSPAAPPAAPTPGRSP